VIRRLFKQLLRNAQQASTPYKTRWGYQAGESRYDNSNTQYAVLGLRSAALCECKVPSSVSLGIINHFLADQADSGDDVNSFTLKTYRDSNKNGRYSLKKYHSRARGWTYIGKANPYGSMTTAGLAGLSIGRDLLAMAGKSPKNKAKKINTALHDGFAWLLTNYSLRKNPRAGKQWHYYYLYGLERACELLGITHINEHDWYFQGAMLLLADRDRAGSWRTIRDTCFALLFLKKATLPGTTVSQ
jgi:hypothetical protein